MLMTQKCTLLAAAITLSSGMLFAQDASSASASSSAAADKTFAMQADEGNSAEIAASQLALKKSKNPDVRDYAQKMITDHQKLRADMAPFAQQMGVTTPQPLNETHQAVAKRLMALSGKQFDMEYIKVMDQDHHKTLGLFQNEIATTSNADLKTAVQQGATSVQMHTDMADQLATKMNIPTATTPTSGN